MTTLCLPWFLISAIANIISLSQLWSVPSYS